MPKLRLVIDNTLSPPIGVIFPTPIALAKHAIGCHMIWFAERPSQQSILGALTRIHLNRSADAFACMPIKLGSYLISDKADKRWWLLLFWGTAEAPEAMKKAMNAFNPHSCDICDIHATPQSSARELVSVRIEEEYDLRP